MSSESFSRISVINAVEADVVYMINCFQNKKCDLDPVKLQAKKEMYYRKIELYFDTERIISNKSFGYYFKDMKPMIDFYLDYVFSS